MASSAAFRPENISEVTAKIRVMLGTQANAGAAAVLEDCNDAIKVSPPFLK